MGKTIVDRERTVKPVLSFLDKSGHRAGEERFHLLQAIDSLGSISAAAKQVGLSYKGAWDAVNALNNLFAKPLVIARPGGRHGGSAEVTEEGRRAMAAHRYLTRKLNEILANLEVSLANGYGLSEPNSPLLWSFAMKTSARNVFNGVVQEVTPGPVNCEIKLKVSESTTLVVIITNESVAALDLQPGCDAFALIKASTPILVREEEAGQTSARNRICGAVLRVEPGAVNTEVIVDIGEGKTLTAIVTKTSAEQLGFQPGIKVCALIKASQIILGVE